MPESIEACLFDLDGVLTRTAAIHARAWKDTFDQFLRTRADESGDPFRPFDLTTDYDEYVDGRPRIEGVRTFLDARGITLPEGADDDPTTAETVRGLGNRKNELLLERIRGDGVPTYEGSIRFVQAAQRAGLRRAVVSSSKNTHEVLRAAELEGLFEVCIDGNVLERDGLQGKPAPDTYLAAARALGVAPGAAAVFEDAIVGVEAGRAGGFGFVVGVDRRGDADELRAHGADVVVADLEELLAADD